MANQDHFRKLFIRSALVTSSTIAALVGAQTLMLLDGEEFNEAPNNSVEEINEVSSVNTLANEAASVNNSVAEANETAGESTQSEIVIEHAAPHIIVLRQSGQVVPQQQTTNNNPVVSNNQSIQPPNPVQIAPPAPVVVQQQSAPVVIQQQSAPAPSRTRSSR